MVMNLFSSSTYVGTEFDLKYITVTFSLDWVLCIKLLTKCKSILDNQVLVNLKIV